MELTELIKNPQRLDRDTLYELRSMLALYPYFQTARLLMLQNLYLLHDPTFDEELRRASIYVTDRRVLFQLVEAAHYQLRQKRTQSKSPQEKEDGNRTISLIDNFLESLPKDDEGAAEQDKEQRKHRKPTPADAAIDYVAYLLECDEDASPNQQQSQEEAPQMKGQNLIDNFIQNDKGKITLNEIPEYVPQINDTKNEEKDGEEGYFTETLARIYIKQGRYSKALQIIRRLSLNYPKKMLTLQTKSVSLRN